MIVSKLVLLLFIAFECFIAYCMRFLPIPEHMTTLSKGILGPILAVITVGVVGAEVFLYRSLSGQVSLKDDNFWFAAMILQGVAGVAIGLNSWSVAKRREKQL
jgi:hypothetical protein